MMESFDHNPEETDDAAAAHRRTRRRALRTLSVLVVLLVLAFTPPLLNVNRLRRRITTSMSASLGRPVYLDGVSLHLLPIPGFTLKNLVVSEDPLFGNEPLLRAMKVDVTLRPSSLWRRQVEISTIRFDVDENGSAPSLNLVRNAQGVWNLQSLLMHASQVNTAPTAQTVSGPAPRFPYIEATGGRVNLKLGDEKQPFSLTDADFALWLPSPEQWRVRIVGKPTRTDTNVADAGTVRLEGQLHKAAQMAQVPVDLEMSWHDAPLGEASKLLTGVDAGWRGLLNVDANLVGPLGDAKITTQVHIDDLRRADFVPAKLLVMNVECDGTVDVTNAVVHDPSCTLPTPGPKDRKTAGQVVAIADSFDLTSPKTPITGLRLGMTNVADDWVMDWARLFSDRIPEKESPGGTVAGSMLFVPASGADAASWQGEFHDTLKTAEKDAGKRASLVEIPATSLIPGLQPATSPVDSDSGAPAIQITGTKTGFVLSPLNVASESASKLPPLMLTGEVDRQSYTLHLAGTATVQQLTTLRGRFPAFGDGLEAAVPELKDAAVKPTKTAAPSFKVNVTCTRFWGAAQTCSAIAPEPSPVSRRKR
jgi:AsmA protein